MKPHQYRELFNLVARLGNKTELTDYLTISSFRVAELIDVSTIGVYLLDELNELYYKLIDHGMIFQLPQVLTPDAVETMNKIGNFLRQQLLPDLEWEGEITPKNSSPLKDQAEEVEDLNLEEMVNNLISLGIDVSQLEGLEKVLDSQLNENRSEESQKNSTSSLLSQRDGEQAEGFTQGSPLASGMEFITPDHLSLQSQPKRAFSSLLNDPTEEQDLLREDEETRTPDIEFKPEKECSEMLESIPESVFPSEELIDDTLLTLKELEEKYNLVFFASTLVNIQNPSEKIGLVLVGIAPRLSCGQLSDIVEMLTFYSSMVSHYITRQLLEKELIEIKFVASHFSRTLLHEISDTTQAVLNSLELLASKYPSIKNEYIYTVGLNAAQKIASIIELNQKLNVLIKHDYLDLQVMDVTAAIVQAISYAREHLPPEAVIHFTPPPVPAYTLADELIIYLLYTLILFGFQNNLNDPPTVWITLQHNEQTEDGETWTLLIEDNGLGVQNLMAPFDDFLKAYRIQHGETLLLLDILVRRYGWVIEINERLKGIPEEGTVLRIEFPVVSPSDEMKLT